MKPSPRALAAALVAATGVTFGALGRQDVAGIAPEALAQIDALLREKETRTPGERKIDSQLLYAMRMRQGLPAAPGVPTLAVDIPYADDGHAIVDVKVRRTARLMARVNGLTGEAKAFPGDTMQLHLDLAQVEQLAADPDVIFVQPQQRARAPGVRRPSAPRAADRSTALGGVLGALSNGLARPDVGPLFASGAGAVTSQGDIAHRAAMFRALTGATGAGVKIGVLALSAGHIAAAQATGDLGPVTVLPGQAGLGGDDGTAMLEVIHDLAPGAQLYFATGYGTIAQFAQNIRDLRSAGCDIIVDAVSYGVESPFQDGQGAGVVSTTNGGLLIQAVKDVTAAGALYFSGTGDNGNLNDGTSGVWEGDFVDGGPTAVPLPAGGTIHAFSGSQLFDTATSSDSIHDLNLFWSDPLGGSANDYDLFLLDSTGTTIVASSTNIQSGTQDPYEVLGSGSAGTRAVIVKKASAANRFLHLNAFYATLGIATAGRIHGHAASSSPLSFAVASSDASAVYPGPFNSGRPVESTSSDGPRRIFFTQDGAAITPGNLSSTGGTVLQKPDFTAADNVSVSGAGGFIPPVLWGGQAAAPHAAAIAALIKSANPSFTPAQTRSALIASAIDIEAPGVDRDSGAGIVMAQAAQPGCSAGLAGPVGVASGASVYAATVTTSAPSCNWVAWSNVRWITIANPAGTGSGQANLIFSANGGGLRNGTITLEGGASINVIQAANPGPPATFDLPTQVSLPAHAITSIPMPISGLTAPISDVTVSLFLAHPFTSALTVSLVGPDGTTVPLSAQHGGTNFGYTCSPASSRTTFSDAMPVSIAQASPPFAGAYRPDQPLAAFRGKIGAAANGTWTLRVDDAISGYGGTVFCASLNVFTRKPANVFADFEGDARADMALFRNNGDWMIRRSSTGFSSSFVQNWGGPADTPVPGDYDGDGIQDPGLYRESTGDWRVLTSSSNFASFLTVNWGGPGLKPVPGDYDGDGKTDPAVYNPATGVWSVLKSSARYGGTLNVGWGGPGYTPVPGQDFDGDGISDIAIYRASTGVWSILLSRTNFTTTISASWGGPTYSLVPGDYDGDAKADLGLYDRSSGVWYVLLSGAGYTMARTINWGGAGYVPVSADFDGDGKIDAGLFQPATGNWYVLESTSNYTSSIAVAGWGVPGDVPVGSAIAAGSGEITRATDYDGDARADIAVYNAASGGWSVLESTASYAGAMNVSLGGAGYTPVSGDFDGDGRTDAAVYQPSTGTWQVLPSSTAFTTTVSQNAGGSAWLPEPADYDGDGKTDFAVYNPGSGAWYVLKSSTHYTTTLSISWGGAGYSAAPGDFDGDGRADLAVYQQSTGNWSVLLSSSNYTTTISKNAGGAGYVPVIADYDGDGKADFGVYNVTTGLWYALKSTTGYTTALAISWGGPGYTPIKGDFDGDGRADPAIYQDSTGGWFILLSSSNYTTALNKNWGGAGYIPVPRYVDD